MALALPAPPPRLGHPIPGLSLDHVFRMTDDTGLLQHATFNVPNLNEGYCIDDNARAFILCSLLEEQGRPEVAERLRRRATTYLAFLSAGLNRERGRFRNFMSYGRLWLEDQGSEDSHGRAIWAVGTGASRSCDAAHRTLCAHLYQRSLEAVSGFTSPRAWAFTLLGIHEYLASAPGHRESLALRAQLTTRIIDLWKACATPDWPWFELSVTYDNARISQALLLSGQGMANPEALAIGLTSLTWLTSVQTAAAGHFRPIGSEGFYPRDGARATFDQQPVEAQATVSACLEAYRATGAPAWAGEALRAFAWFLGDNDLGVAVYDALSGGCRDGLHPDRPNENQGAESTLAFHLALAELTAAGLLR